MTSPCDGLEQEIPRAAVELRMLMRAAVFVLSTLCFARECLYPCIFFFHCNTQKQAAISGHCPFHCQIAKIVKFVRGCVSRRSASRVFCVCAYA
jgi:hypothetical protein